MQHADIQADFLALINVKYRHEFPSKSKLRNCVMGVNRMAMQIDLLDGLTM